MNSRPPTILNELEPCSTAGMSGGAQRAVDVPRRVVSWLRHMVAAALCLLACSCQTVQPTGTPPQPLAETPPAAPPQLAMAAPNYPAPNYPAPTFPVQQVAYAPAALPPGAFTGAPWGGYAAMTQAEMGHPAMPASGGCCPSCGPSAFGSGEIGGDAAPHPWRPPHIPGPWPQNEYLCDGGDSGVGVEVRRDWTVLGLDPEDTVAHYDTIDGRLEVEPSNRVCVYAPRFGSVRKVYGIQQHENRFRASGVNTELRLQQREERSLATTVIQPVQPERYFAANAADTFRDQTRGMGVANAQRVFGLQDRFKLFEDFQVIKQGRFDNSEKARLNLWLDAAQTWTSEQMVQVTIDNVRAVVATGDLELQSVYRYEMPEGKPRLRVVKVASTKHAQPGDEIEFTIRFDNIGDQLVGNVTIVDNLVTRLEYVPGSAQCDLPATFLTQENAQESLVLRWEINEPLDVGQGGIIRFKCRVR